MLGIACCFFCACVIAFAGPALASAAAKAEHGIPLCTETSRQTLVLAQADAPSQGSAVSITALSRGSGVPAAASSALAQVRDMLTAYQTAGAALQMTEARIGIEGERRLCAIFADPALADAAWQRIRQIAAGVDLVDISQRPCPPDGSN
jgi:hypothetical protein